MTARDIVSKNSCRAVEMPSSSRWSRRELRSMTGGRASFEMEFSHYEQVPQHITQKVVTEAQAAAKKT